MGDLRPEIPLTVIEVHAEPHHDVEGTVSVHVAEGERQPEPLERRRLEEGAIAGFDRT